MAPKILLIGEYYSENLGDPLLCQTVKRTIEEAYPNVEVIPFDMSGKINASDRYPLEKHSIGMKIFFAVSAHFPLFFRRSALFRAYTKNEPRYLQMWYSLNHHLKEHSFDCVVFAGGALFMDYFAGIIRLIVGRFAFTNTKIIFHACGMGRLNSDSVRLLKKAFSSKNIVSISLRDSYSRFMDTFHVRCPVVETYDTALSCKKYFDSTPFPDIEYGLGLMAEERFYEAQKKLVRYFLNSSHSWRIFTNGASFDYSFAVRLLTDLGVSDEKMDIYLMNRPLTSDQLVSTVIRFKKIIALRMHCQIIAASFGIPSFGLAWNYKVEEFYEKLGFPQHCAIELPALDDVFSLLENCSNQICKRATVQGGASQKALLHAVEHALNQTT